MTLHALVPLAALVLLPGLLVGAALGLRGWLLAGAAPVVTFGIVGIAAPLVPALGLTWSALTLAGTAAVLAAGGLGARLALAGRLPNDPPAAEERRHWGLDRHAAVVVGVGIAGGVGAYTGWNATRGLTAVPQWWDAFWHMNAIRFIADTGNPSPEALRALNEPQGPFFYPDGWHALLAALCRLTGVSPIAAIDGSMVAVVGAFALGTATLVRVCGGRAALAAASALLSCAVTAFPYDIIGWGPLFPFVIGLAMVPGLLALLAALLRTRSGNRVGLPVALAVGALGGLAIHPSVVVAAFVFGVALLVQQSRHGRWSDLGALAVAAVVAVVLGFPFVRATLAATDGAAVDWPATEPPSDAIGAMITFGHAQTYPQYWIAVLCLVGLLRRRALRPMLWYVVAGGVFAGLFVLAASYEGSLVAALTRPWWNDRWRFAALWGMAAVVLAGAGLVGITDALAGLVRRVRATRHATAVASVLAAAVVVAGSKGLYQARNQERMTNAYPGEVSVSAQEQRVFGYLAGLVPPGQTVMNDPFDGSAAMWALAGVRPLFPSPTIEPQELVTMEPDRKLLWTSFRSIGSDPAVRAAADRLGIRYAVVGDDGFIAGGEHVRGMRDLAGVPGLELVHTDQDVRVYRITG